MLQKETSGIVPPYAVCSARLFKSEEVRRIYVGMVEWQTQWFQNPPSNREGSSPSSGTIYARVVELADTLDLGSSISDVQVRVLSRAPLRSGSSWSLASLINWRSWVRVPPPQPNATMVEQADTRNLKFLGLSVPVRVWVVAPLFLDVVQFGRTLDLGSRGSQVRFLSSRPFGAIV